MKTIAGFVLCGQDISTFFFAGAPKGVVCPNCKANLNLNYVPAHVRVNESQGYGLGHTYDHQPLFSGALIDLLIAKTTTRFDFFAVSDVPDYYHVITHDTIAFDSVRRRTEFLSACSDCGNFSEIIGATPAYLRCNSLDPYGFYRTDLEFGSTNGKSPLLIVGIDLKNAIEAEKFPGIHFKDAYAAEAD